MGILKEGVSPPYSQETGLKSAAKAAL